MTKRMHAIMSLGAVPQLGPASIRKLLLQLQKQDTSLELLIEFNHRDLLELGLSDIQADAFLDAGTLEIAEQMSENEISILVATDADAPIQFTDSRLTPWFFYRGDSSVLARESIGFSGSRDASPYAMRITTEMAVAATARGWVVISGGARGVDTAAHQAAVESGGTTVVVLPQGIGTWRMPAELDSCDTLVISEFMPLDDWGSFRAMQRNRSIIHLSDRLVIPQSGERGGTKNAGEYALKQERPIWVVDLGEEFSGNLALIEKGATSLVWDGNPAALDELAILHDPNKPAQQSLF